MRVHIPQFLVRARELVLDIAFPPSARAKRVRSYGNDAIIPRPLEQHIGRHSLLSLAAYDDEAVKTAVRTLKFENSAHAAHLFGQLLADYLLESLVEEALFDALSVAIVPVPLGKKRLRERGHNQVEQVLLTLPSFGITVPIRTDMLLRVRDTNPQTSLGRAERLKNVAGAFDVQKGVDCSGMHIYLVDDVMTTGATLIAAAQALEAAGAQVTALALCRA